jgi:hypothetical protein
MIDPALHIFLLIRQFSLLSLWSLYLIDMRAVVHDLKYIHSALEAFSEHTHISAGPSRSTICFVLLSLRFGFLKVISRPVPIKSGFSHLVRFLGVKLFTPLLQTRRWSGMLQLNSSCTAATNMIYEYIYDDAGAQRTRRNVHNKRPYA